MDKDLNSSHPTREAVRHELRAHLLADVLRAGTLFGNQAGRALLGLPATPPVGLVNVSPFQRQAWVPVLDDVDLDAIPAGLNAMAMYDYAFDGHHPIGITPDVFSAEIESFEDFVTSFRSDLFDLFLADQVHSQGAPSGTLLTLCEHTRVRLHLDMGQGLPVQDIALLAGMGERSVRNMLTFPDEIQRLKADKNGWVDNSEARRWLSNKRGFVPTVFTNVSYTPGEHPDALSSWLELGRYLDERWHGLGKTLDGVLEELDWVGTHADLLKALPAEPHLIDPKDCEDIAKTLLVSPSWFTTQVLRLKYPRQMELLMQASAAPQTEAAKPQVDRSDTCATDPGFTEALCTRLVFVLNDGTKMYPARMKNRQTKRVAFRLSQGGLGGNTLEAGEEVEDEDQMIDLVVNRGYAVRMASERGGMKSLFKLKGRVVRQAYLDGQAIGSEA